MNAAVFLSFVGLCFVTGEASVLKEEKDVEKSLVPNSPRFLQRRATTVLYDDFSSGHVDPHKWGIYVSASGVRNHEFQMYTPEPVNVYVKNGMLYLHPTLTVDKFGNDFLTHGTLDAKAVWGTCSNWDCSRTGSNQIHPIMSGMVSSLAHIKYGKVEVVAKMPRGDWLTPAIWLMPADFHYGHWPRSGEIDIMEAAGNQNMIDQNGDSAGCDRERSLIHYGLILRTGFHKTHEDIYKIPGTTFANGFHTWWLDWTEDYIKIGVDAHTTLVVNTPANGFWAEGRFQSQGAGPSIWSHGGKNAPFDQPFYLILSVAVGGDFFGNGFTNHPYARPWDPTKATQMMDFWNARNHWYPTWQGEDVAMKIRSVKMEQY